MTVNPNDSDFHSSESSFTEPNLAVLRQLTADFIKERKWGFYHTPKALSIAISIEAAELLEHFLFKEDSASVDDLEAFTDEMADIFIYLMSLANTLHLPSFGQIVERKMEKNRSKYPVEQFSGKNYVKQ